MKKLLILFMSFCLCGCEDAAANIKAKCEYLGEHIEKCDLGNVVCYKYTAPYRGGLSCLKKDEGE